MNLKLKKKVEGDRLFYLIADADKPDTFYDYFEYPHYKETSNIETVCFKMIGSELLKAYKEKDFSSNGFRKILFILHGLIIEGGVIDIASANILTKLVNNIRYRDLYNVINSFRKNLSIKGLRIFKDKVLEIEVTKLSEDTQNLFKEFVRVIDYKKDTKVLFREILYLAIINEYSRAYVKVEKKDRELEQFRKNFIASGKKEIEDEEE